MFANRRDRSEPALDAFFNLGAQELIILLIIGVSLSVLDLLLINTVANLIGGLAPSPGGMGAVEAGLIAGFTAFGIDTSIAGAATFTYRLFTGYLPPAWGYPTMAWMRRRDLL